MTIGYPASNIQHTSLYLPLATTMTPQMLRQPRTTILPYPSCFVIPIRQPIFPQWIASRTRLSRLYATASSTTSVRAHNARPSLPLHDTLEQLKPVLLALRNTGYGDISRVELALRGLEQGDSPSRIAGESRFPPLSHSTAPDTST